MSPRFQPTTPPELHYLSHLAPEQAKQHHVATRYPSGRPSKGGANRSSNIKRVIKQLTRTVTFCPACGGVAPDITQLTSLFIPCSCPAPTT